MSGKTLKIWLFFLVVVAVLPLLHTFLLSYIGAVQGSDNSTYLFLLFEAPIWVTLVAFFQLEIYRHDIFKPIGPLGCAGRLSMFGLLTPLLALLISPTVNAMGFPISALLSLTGCLTGFLGGSVYWLILSSSRPETDCESPDC
jgi:hypothetical protein